MSADGGGFYGFAAAPSPAELAKYDLNDFGNAMRLIRMVGGLVGDDYDVGLEQARLLYVLGAGWVAYNGQFWDREQGDDLARRAAHKVAIALRHPDVVAILKERLAAKDVLKFLDDSGSAGKTSSMLKQAQSYLTVRLDVFDRDPLAINCKNGTLRMRRAAGGGFEVKLDRHDPSDRITRMADASWNPDAEAEEFKRTLHHSLPDKDDREYFQRACAYAATGCVQEQALFLFQGRGRDGKSTLLDACRDTLGTYGETASPLTFLDGGVQSGSGPSPDLVKLSGDVRFCVLSEPKRGLAWNEGLIKAWTSGSPVTARDLNAKPFSFRPRAKLLFEMNNLPPARGDDDGIWRRFLTLFFPNQVPKEQVDKALGERIRANEREGVLRWLVEGVGDWLERGLDPPESTLKLVDDYRRTSSPFGDWLSERCIWGTDAAEKKPDGSSVMARTLVSELHRNFKEWAEEQGHEKTPMSPRAFGDALRDRGVGLAGKDAKGRKYRGPIRLKELGELDGAADSEPGAGGRSGSDMDEGRFAPLPDTDSPGDWGDR